MKSDFISVLGSGSSAGLPVLGCKCPICLSNSPRSRSSIFFHNEKILFDAGPDIKQQLTYNKIYDINKIVISHEHSDHIIGLWEFHVLFKYFHKEIDLYIRKHDFESIKSVLSFCIKKFNLKLIQHDTRIDNMFFQEQQHGNITNLTMRYKDVVYANDFSFILHSDIFHDSKIIFLDCADWTSTYSHVGFDFIHNMLTFDCNKIYLINLSHKLDFNELQEKIKKSFGDKVQLTYDNMIIQMP